MVPFSHTLATFGGFVGAFSAALSNEATSTTKKVKEISYTSVATASTLSSTLGGAFIGQMAIPIPVIGAILGGVSGGYFCSKDSLS